MIAAQLTPPTAATPTDSLAEPHAGAAFESAESQAVPHAGAGPFVPQAGAGSVVPQAGAPTTSFKLLMSVSFFFATPPYRASIVHFQKIHGQAEEGTDLLGTHLLVSARAAQERNAMLTKEELPPCPVATTLMLIGNKWKIFIIQQLMDRPFRFGELRRAIPGISEKVLTDNLRAMEKDGIITRTVFPEVPPRTEYALSELGNTMRPIIESMATWGTGYQQLVREQ